MSRTMQLLLHSTWNESAGPRNLYILLFILALMMAYASMFSFFVEIFGTTTRVFPALYIAIAATSWGIRGAIPVTILNVALNIFLFKHTGHTYEGGIVGPAGCLFAASLVGIISDLARQLEKQLQERRALENDTIERGKRYRQLFDMVSDAILVIDWKTGKILEANASASKIYGYNHDEFLQLSCMEISDQPDETRAAIQNQENYTPLRYHKRKNGVAFPAEITAKHFSLKDKQVQVIAIRDITSRIKAEEDKKRLETQFYQAQKMKSIGTLAGGVAHDFNNLLGGIMGNASLGQLKISPDNPAFRHLEVIERLSKIGANLTKHILGFARGGKYHATTTDINKLISEHNFMFGHTHKHIIISEDYHKDLWVADVDQGQIEQVLFNIYINSMQAMGDKGSIFVSTENIIIGNSTAFPFPVKAGEYIQISVQDNGSGMDETTQQRIFEPFYSTKEKEVGTGLGMAAAYGIIKNHGGYIHALSKLGKGTTIIMLLPRSRKKIKEDTRQSAVTIESGSGTIMVVDDEEEMLKVVTEIFQVMGYKVLAANSGIEAISMFRENKKTIDLVVLDIAMPLMSGEETYNRLKEIDESVKVLFQTGYSQEKEMDFVKTSCGVIRKPFTIDSLSKKIKAALNSTQAILPKERAFMPMSANLT